MNLSNVPQGFNDEGNSIWDNPITDNPFDLEELAQDIATGEEPSMDILFEKEVA
jgi:hypothetical protein